jgi:hypothetical protein
MKNKGIEEQVLSRISPTEHKELLKLLQKYLKQQNDVWELVEENVIKAEVAWSKLQAQALSQYKDSLVEEIEKAPSDIGVSHPHLSGYISRDDVIAIIKEEK